MIFDYDWVRSEVAEQIEVVVAEPKKGTWLVVRGEEDAAELFGIIQEVIAFEGPEPAVTLRIWVTEDQEGHDDLQHWLIAGGSVEVRFASEEELAAVVARAN